YEFTAGQSDVMNADLNSPERIYCNPGIQPTLETPDGLPVLNIPVNGFDEVSYNTMYFQWSAVPGATQYLLEISTSQTFDANAFSNIYTTNEALVTDYGQPDQWYFWRVRPFNEYRTCTGAGSPANFTTSDTPSNTNDLKQLNSWSITPNPSNVGALLQIQTIAASNFDGTIMLKSLSGSTLLEKKQRFNTGQNATEIATVDLPAGLYFISIKTNEEITTKKILIY
ncbi:MAG: T9SS type A sorting domain-containing protein, partial [Saprospiraceae bacterium]